MDAIFGWLNFITGAVKEFLAPVLAYFLGREQGKKDTTEKVLKDAVKELQNENKDLRDAALRPDSALADELQRRGDAKARRED